MIRPELPKRQGLYDPAHEHDACGVGFVASLKGERSHGIIRMGLEILVNLTHRGACGCDPETGDGAGLLLQLPHTFFMKQCADLPFNLPGPGKYGVGMVFLPPEIHERNEFKVMFERVVNEEGQIVLGWRLVPTNNECIGRVARQAEPAIRQIFIAPRDDNMQPDEFERKLYVIRKRIEHVVRESGHRDAPYFHVPSLSHKTLNYKGLLLADQIESYYPDLTDESMKSALAMVHQRYSTNTFPTWDLAQPFRILCHNGEINTLRGNVNWMYARQAMFQSDTFGEDMQKLFPIITPNASDSACLDNALELLTHTGRSLPHAIRMLIPEAWSGHETMPDDLKAFYEYHASMVEPWDGPASIPFTDGVVIGAVLDRNGLRPSRYTVTKDDLVVMGSEAGVLEIAPENVKFKGRLQPGRMFLVDMKQGRIISDEEIKRQSAERRPYRQWLNEHQVRIENLPEPDQVPSGDPETLVTRQRAFGYTLEHLRIILGPMATNGVEPIGSMGNDSPLAVLSDHSPLLYTYFKQLFAQVTNPPLDAIREELVTALDMTLGETGNLFDETPEHCHQLKIAQPILSLSDLEKVRRVERNRVRSKTLSTVFPVADGAVGMKSAIDALCAAASSAIDAGYTILILSDRDVDADRAPIPALLSCSAVHHHLIREGKRTRAGLVIESGEPREVHHFALLLAYGAGAICPYLAYETLADMIDQHVFENGIDITTAAKNYIKAIGKGLLKVMSKMGISTVQSYCGAQIVEAVGLNQAFIDQYFTWTPSRIGGVGLDVIAEESIRRHRFAYPPTDEADANLDLDVGGEYQWRRRGERHLITPEVVSQLQIAARHNNETAYKKFAQLVNDQSRRLCTLRGMLDFRRVRQPIPIDEVEPIEAIVTRFATGAMSFGSISKEAHENLAIAMNRLGGKSNTGEGGEDPDRFTPDPNGDLRRSAVKQVASGRFGVTSWYLVNADELQIKMAQGAKPGEGGQLPGHKVDEFIAKIRNSTPGVGLISPPPHHDIYSIEDLAQLIHDLKNANRHARICVKLVAEVGVGTVAAGVSKGKSDVVLISGDSGGTGASPQTSIKHAGLPWELGLAETHQTLVMNDLRSRIIVQTDGKLMTGRDVAIACLLGAEEFGFATAPLMASGCIMMRKCHLNTCPVGIATQDKTLRKKFAGKPEHVVNYFRFVAGELREIMASLGFRTVNEMIGRVDQLATGDAIHHWKARGIDLTQILFRPDVPERVGTYRMEEQDHGLDQALDNKLIELAAPALERGEPVEIDMRVQNINRTVGTMLSAEISRRHGPAGLPEGTIQCRFTGSAGQSFCAFGAPGLSMVVEGDVNDYLGKGLSGAQIVVYPPKVSSFVPEENIICGNVALYGATDGTCFIRGQAGERFCVRNSGAQAVVEGVGDHGCEYMTGGRVVILGHTGRNFAAGMSGGIAYVLDEVGDFAATRCNQDMVDLEEVTDPIDIAELRHLIEEHLERTGSGVAQRVLDNFEDTLEKFVKVMPKDLKRVLSERKKQQERPQPAVTV
jgi:glutamate synthase domain-containing protein 2/glutamate synthase domain-containing protein 1/glutamate synthase domain-containing protein 3